MTTVLLDGHSCSVENIVSIARHGARLEVAESVRQRLHTARCVLEEVAASGKPIYGMNTGLGANLKTPVTKDFEAFQLQLIRGRGMAVGRPLRRAATRAVIATRLAMLSVGGSGISPPVFEALLKMLNAGVHPILPDTGSIGAGDLVLLSAMARGLVGEGQAEYQGQVHEARRALGEAGLQSAKLAPKDGISLINASAASVGLGALTLHAAMELMQLQSNAAALSFEGLGGNPQILSPSIQVARPAEGQAVAAAELLEALQGSSLFQEPVAIQDPLSLRCVASIHGALKHSMTQAISAVEIELNSAADNPVVLIGERQVVSTGNFHTPSISLAFEGLGLAIAQAASASAARFIQLTGTARNGLPRYLSPVGGASAGLVPLQKTVAALMAKIRHKANPIALDFLVVSEGVEDHATQSMAVVQKIEEMLDPWIHIIACELVAAAQAIDHRANHRCGRGTEKMYRVVREAIPKLDEDRALGDEISAFASQLLAEKEIAVSI